MLVVSNSSPLIYLAKIHQIALLQELFGEILVPFSVYTEVITIGKDEGYSDANLVEEAVKDGWLQVSQIRSKIPILEKFGELDDGERDAIALAVEKKAELVLIDDAAGRHVAKALHLRVKGTLYVILLALQKNLINPKEAKNELEHLLQARFRLSPELYAMAIKEIERWAD